MTLRVGVWAMPFDAQGVDFVHEAERMGADSVWIPEYWAFDALTPLGFLAASTSTIRLASGIVQFGARTPAMLAMSALSLQTLSGGRFVLGIGTSGPQVMEGWHGVRFDRPVRRTRETIEIIRAITAGERLDYHGEIYTLPLPDGEGRSIRSPVAADRTFPIYVASLGPANLRMTGELADGWIGNSFFPETADVFLDPIRARRSRRRQATSPTSISRSPSAWSSPTTSRRPAAAMPRGMRSRSARWDRRRATSTTTRSPRQGYGDDVREVQRLWLAGDRDAARKRVPTAIGLGTNLIGTDDLVRERLRLYRDAGITTLRVGLASGPGARGSTPTSTASAGSSTSSVT